MNTSFQILRIVAVIALVCIAAALATPKDRLPLALRGLAKLLRTDTVPAASRRAGAGERVGWPAPARRDAAGTVSVAKRALAFLLVILAILLALI